MLQWSVSGEVVSSRGRVVWTLNPKIPLNPLNLKIFKNVLPTEFNRITLMPKFKALQDQSLC